MSVFDIPSEAAAAFSDQAEPDPTDFRVLAAGFLRSGVVSGCAVTAQGSPDMTLAVAAGVAMVNGVMVAVTSGNVTITTANATNPRFDLVVVDNAGAKSVTAGTAAANPAFPAIPSNSVVLAAVYVPANDTAIGSTQIVDKRVLFTDPPVLAPGSASGVLGNTGMWYGYPSATTTFNPVVGSLRLSPLHISKRLTFDRIGIEVTSFGASTAVCRLGIWADTGAGYPGALVLDAGTVATETPNGSKEITISKVLNPGLYWLGYVAQVINCTVRHHAGAAGMNTGLPTNTNITPGNYSVEGVTGALSAQDPFTSVVTHNAGGGPLVRLRAA
jgi:hypothetical protein